MITRPAQLKAPLLCSALLAAAANAQVTPEWTLETGNVTPSPVKFADVDGDGIDEVVIATMGPVGNPYNSGQVHVLAMDGQELPGWPLNLDRPITGAGVAVGDIDHDGDFEIVAQGWFNLWVWNHDGTNLTGWPKATGTSSSASPLLVDLDGDDDLEIVVPYGSTMHAWHHDGSEASGWPQFAGEMFQAASAADLDGDGEPEIVAGTWRPQFPDTVPFELFAWNADGTSVSGFPVGNLGSVRGPVSLGDIDGDSDIEIVARAGDTIHVFSSSGVEESGWPVVFSDPIRNATPSLGDIDGDGDLEIVIGGYKINALHHDGTVVSGFPINTAATGNINSGVVIASVDDEGDLPEIMVKITDALLAFDGDGSTVGGFPYVLSDDNQSATFSATPAASDMDGDGDIEFAAISVSGRLAFFDEAEPANPDVEFWPQFQHDPFNTSYVPPRGDKHGTRLTDFLVTTGTLLDGDLADLESSDDSFVHARSGFGQTLVDLHNMTMVVSANTTMPTPTLIDLSIETRLNHATGSMQIRMKNCNTGLFDLLGTRAINSTEQIFTVNDVDASNYVDGAGNIDLQIKQIVFVPQFAFLFESWIDWVEILVHR